MSDGSEQSAGRGAEAVLLTDQLDEGNLCRVEGVARGDGG